MKKILPILMVLMFAVLGFAANNSFGVRAAGMGDAFTAVADDASAVFYNPAGLPYSDFELSSDSLDWERSVHDPFDLTLLTIDGFGYANYLQKTTAGNATRGQLYGFGTKGRSGINWGITYKELGLNGKGLDIGLLVNITEQFSVGLSGQNISVIELDVPFALRAGAAYSLWNKRLKLAVDYVSLQNSVNRFHYGAELALLSGLALRAGVSDKKGTIGAGLSILGGEFNYASDIDPDASANQIHKLGFSLITKTKKARKRALFAESKFLEININSNIVSGQDEFSVLGGFSIGADTLLKHLRQANKDKDISGIIVKMSGFPGGLFATGLVQSLREELITAKNNGKKIIFYLENGAIGNAYYLASAADSIIMPDLAIAGGIGSRLQIVRMHKLFQKLGIDWEILARGKYKASLNNMSKEISPEGKEEINSLIKDVYERMLVDISESRDIELGALRELADGSLLTASEALHAGLIDSIGYYSEAKKSAKILLGKEESKSLPLLTLEDIEQEPPVTSMFTPWNRIAVINIEGPITLGENSRSIFWGGSSTGADTIVKQLGKIQNDSSIQAVIIRLNTPGGSAIASDRVYQAIRKLRKEHKKTVIASMGDLAASGGYYIASACDRIIANPGTFTGSIGVIGMFPSMEKLFKNIGIEPEEYKEGQYMDAFSTAGKLSPEARAMMENIMQTTYDKFVTSVAKGRGISEEEAYKLAEGRLYTGSQAVNNGLADELGNFSRAVASAKELSNIRGEETLVYYHDQSSLWLQNIGVEATKILGLDKGLLPEIKTTFQAFRIY
ncbi:signal peptide peptidase SppA [Candidatus Margulisiibacteriota bacterium]